MKNSFQLFRAVCSSIGDKNFNGNKLIYALVTHDRCSMTFQNMSTALKHCLLSYANVSRCFLLIKQNPVLILYHHRHRQLYFFILPFSCPLRQWNAVKQQKKNDFFFQVIQFESLSWWWHNVGWPRICCERVIMKHVTFHNRSIFIHFLRQCVCVLTLQWTQFDEISLLSVEIKMLKSWVSANRH